MTHVGHVTVDVTASGAHGAFVRQFVAPGADCHDSTPVTPTLDAGAVYDICVTAVVSLPGVPTVLTGKKNTVTGVYTVHIGDLREGR